MCTTLPFSFGTKKTLHYKKRQISIHKEKQTKRKKEEKIGNKTLTLKVLDRYFESYKAHKKNIYQCVAECARLSEGQTSS